MIHALEGIDFFSPEIVENPFAANALARRTAPVHRLPGTSIYAVSTFDLVVEVTSRPDVFSNDFKEALQGKAVCDPEIQSILARGWPQVDTLLTADPPHHTRFRKLVNLAFTPVLVNNIEADIEARADALIDQFIDNGRCEFVKEFAVPLPLTVIARQVGVPQTDLAQFKEWSDAFTSRLGSMLTRDQELDCARKIVAFQHYMHARLEERRAAPRDDLLSDLVQARVDGEHPLDTAELLSVVQQLLVAGNETTTHSLAAAMLFLIQNPTELAKVQAQPDLLKNMVEETLRLATPTNSMWRVVKRDTILGGMGIPAGAMLLLRFGSANRDESKFQDPDRFDVERKNANQHLAFGRGVHSCVGNLLSRKELQVAFRRILARLKNFRLGSDNDLRHHPNVLLRGLKKLNIEFECV